MTPLFPIPLKTHVPYQVDEAGNVYRDGKQIVAWTHYPPKRYGSNPYQRVRIKMHDGESKFFYVQRLMGIVFFGLTIDSPDIMRHGPLGSLNNSRANLSKGTHYQNQTEDRKAQGTYMARGGNKVEDVKIIEEISGGLKPIEVNF